MKRRDFSAALISILAGMKGGLALAAEAGTPEADKTEPKHICKGLNECKGQGNCMHGCGDHSCAGKNSCKGKGGCAAAATHHSCKGKNSCKGVGGCASGDNKCAGFNSCKGKGGCEVPLNYEHKRPRFKEGKPKTV